MKRITVRIPNTPVEFGAKKKRRKPQQAEQSIQECYTLWLRSKGVLFCASCGGMRTSLGTAVKMKKAGYVKGVPDMAIYEPRGPYHGLFVELKSKTGKSAADQKKWRDDLNARGYYAIIAPIGLDYRKACDWLETETEKYLSIKTQREAA